MTYAEFKESFLPELLKIKSFKGKMDYARQNLQSIGGGSGRIVYDIDGEKVLKLAKNPKGIAQNEAEAGAGYYRDTQHIVTIVFDNADDDSWLIAEKAKKVNEKRIKELTGIPSLNDLWMYLKDFHSSNNGKGNIFGLDKNIVEQLNENEFAQDLQNFIANYSQEPGDYGRPSTYGEVLRDGQPSIVLTDYGLNDEVYDTHYAPKKQGRMYELYNFADGNDDILSDLPPQDAVDTRQSMWALMPYSVGDGDGVINERFINFVENNNKYPTRRILPNTPSLIDEFHNVVNNLNEVLEKVDNKKKFYNNLLELQNYLIRGKFYDREPLEKEVMGLDEVDDSFGQGLERNYADEIAKLVATKLNLGNPQYLGGGGFGVAYLVNNNRVLKLTTDKCEVDAGGKTHRAKPKHLIYVHKIYKVIDSEQKSLYALIEDFIPDKPVEQFSNYINIVSSLGDDLYGSLLGLLIKGKSKAPDFVGKTLDDFPESAKLILTLNPDANISNQDRQGAYQFMMNLYAIRLDLLNLGIKSYDYVEPKNLGYKDGLLVYFDIGNCRAEEPEFSPEDIITLEEDGSALYSTPNSIGTDNFPVYNNTDDGSPLQDNNLPVNIFAEDLEYNHVVGDATTDTFEISERKMSSMPGSQSVEVKKKCRLAGNGNTSTACNQGDIGNLNFKSINETVSIDLPSNLGGYDSFKIMNDNQVVGEVGIMDRGVHGGNHYIAIDKIFIDKNFRGKNYANDAMKILFQYADKNNLIITLTPDNMWGASVPKLKAWYQSLGFIMNKGKKKDFQTMQLMYRIPKAGLNEVIDASEAYRDEGAMNAMVRGDKDVAIILFKSYPNLRQIAIENDFGIIPIEQTSHKLDTSIVYRKTPRGEANAKRLHEIMKSHGGYVQDKTPEEAREIGKLLDYSDESINGFIQRIYGKKVSQAPEYADYEQLNEQTVKDFEKLIHKDNKTHGLDKFHLYDQDDFKVYAVNGEAVRDNGFDEWVDGGHHYVDADEKPKDQKYAKFIPEDEIWVDDVFLIKPNDLSAILLHERLERFLMKYYGLKYENAHTNFANPAEVIFRKKTKEGFDADVSNKIYDIFVKKFAKKHTMKKKLNESLNESQELESTNSQGNPIHPTAEGIANFWKWFGNSKAVDQNGRPLVVYHGTTADFDEFIHGGWHGNILDVKNSYYFHTNPAGADYFASHEKGSILPVYLKIENPKIFRKGDDWSLFIDDLRKGNYDGAIYDTVSEQGDPHMDFYKNWEKFGEVLSVFSKNQIKSATGNNGNFDGNDNNMLKEAQLMSLEDLPFKQEVEQLGGKIYSVGGAVRDEFLGKQSKDLDILITGIPMEQLEEILGKYGRVSLEGKSFGILKFKPKGATEDIDIAIPRTDIATGGGGHKDIETISNHELPIEKDLERRDYTINAIAKDMEGNLIDPYNGQQDIKNKIIRAVNPEAFSDDPLRMLRAVQFASRFGFTIEPKTMQMIKDTASSIKKIPPERILTEFDKIVQKGNIVVGANLLHETGLFKEMFGESNPSFIAKILESIKKLIERFGLKDNPLSKAKTMGEFVYLLIKNVSDTPSELYKTQLKGDISTEKEIKALDYANKNVSENKIKNRGVAFNMFAISPKSLESEILPNEIKVAAQELLSGKYPKSINDLVVNGNDLIQLGLKGKEIGEALKMMLLKIYSNKVSNSKEELLSLVPRKNGVNENAMGNVKYSAVVLDERSKERLIERFRKDIPESWEILAHHLTINMGGIDKQYEKFLGMDVDLTVTHMAIDDKVMAVAVSGFPTVNKIPHITVAVNRQGGGKPMMSNNLTNWTNVKVPLVITGKVTEVI